VTHFCLWMTSMLHRCGDDFDAHLQLSQLSQLAHLAYVTSSASRRSEPCGELHRDGIR
jgi:hypothetical protein